MDEANIDAICMWLLKNPFNYDVLVAPNLYGDIISDLAAQMVGGLGFGCSGNIGQKLAVFEPSHGSAPKYAGQYKVNPIATILAAKMMLDWLGEAQKGDAIEKAVAAVIREGAVRTYDMGGASSTLQMAEAIAKQLGD
jgi:3-isopropylmalate dehydrogenase